MWLNQGREVVEKSAFINSSQDFISFFWVVIFPAVNQISIPQEVFFMSIYRNLCGTLTWVCNNLFNNLFPSLDSNMRAEAMLFTSSFLLHLQCLIQCLDHRKIQHTFAELND